MSRKARPQRNLRIAEQIQRDLSELIARELKDPRVGMPTISAVELSPDYAHAKVYFSLLVGDTQEAQSALNQAAGFLRNHLFRRLHIHTVPTLRFFYDPSTERASEMDALIARAVASNTDNASNASNASDSADTDVDKLSETADTDTDTDTDADDDTQC